MGWTEWANDVVFWDYVTYECEECDFKGDIYAECEGTGTRWTAYVACPDCGSDGYRGGN